MIFTTKTKEISRNKWIVEILQEGQKIGEYKRNYPLLNTFCPFQQNDN